MERRIVVYTYHHGNSLLKAPSPQRRITERHKQMILKRIQLDKYITEKDIDIWAVELCTDRRFVRRWFKDNGAGTF